MLAKDLLRYYENEDEFDVRDNLRPAVFVPESKPLNILLREATEMANVRNYNYETAKRFLLK